MNEPKKRNPLVDTPSYLIGIASGMFAAIAVVVALWIISGPIDAETLAASSGIALGIAAVAATVVGSMWASIKFYRQS